MDILTYLKWADNAAADSGSSVAASTSNSAFPVANVKTLPVSNVWRSTATSSQILQVVFGAARTVRVAALINHNLTSSATITLIGASNESFTNDRFTHGVEPYKGNAWALLPTDVTRQRWRFEISDLANPDGFLSVGVAMLGAATVLPQQFQPGWTRSPRKIIRKTESDLGTPLVGRIVSHGWRLAFEWLLDDAATDTTEDWLDSLGGDPVFVMPVPSRHYGHFVRLEDPREPWQTVVAQDNGPNRISASFVTDNDGFDVGV